MSESWRWRSWHWAEIWGRGRSFLQLMGAVKSSCGRTEEDFYILRYLTTPIQTTFFGWYLHHLLLPLKCQKKINSLQRTIGTFFVTSKLAYTYWVFFLLFQSFCSALCIPHYLNLSFTNTAYSHRNLPHGWTYISTCVVCNSRLRRHTHKYSKYSIPVNKTVQWKQTNGSDSD